MGATNNNRSRIAVGAAKSHPVRFSARLVLDLLATRRACRRGVPVRIGVTDWSGSWLGARRAGPDWSDDWSGSWCGARRAEPDWSEDVGGAML
ncbi:hypothetical protein Raf01_74520 [Rugosimonospora africana]|uniref:Uncharacterized protein n=1 Tax=Rugosimonospora africana TaxID=556532 RepID=A0A8J3R0T0_9ACTN|nr:hypothetical protein Raf01_74520 [Rugosimonospora africana]